MPFILSVDFDGTIFTNTFPEKGEPQQEIIDKGQLPLPKGRGFQLSNSHYWLLKPSFFLLPPGG